MSDGSLRAMTIVAVVFAILVSTVKATLSGRRTHCSGTACSKPPDRNDAASNSVSCASCPNGYFVNGNYCVCDDRGVPYCAKLAPDPPVQEPSRCLGAPRSTPVDCTVCGTGYFDGCNHCRCTGGSSSTSVGLCSRRSCGVPVGGAYCLYSAPLGAAIQSPTSAPTEFLPQCIVDADSEPLEEFEATFWVEYVGPSRPFTNDENAIIDPILQQRYNEIVTCDTLIYAESLSWTDVIFFEGDDGISEEGGNRRLQRTSLGVSRLANKYTASGRCRGCRRSFRLFNDLSRRLFVQLRDLQQGTTTTTSSSTREEFYEAVVDDLNDIGFTEIQSIRVLGEDPTPFPTSAPTGGDNEEDPPNDFVIVIRPFG